MKEYQTRYKPILYLKVLFGLYAIIASAGRFLVMNLMVQPKNINNSVLRFQVFNFSLLESDVCYRIVYKYLLALIFTRQCTKYSNEFDLYRKLISMSCSLLFPYFYLIFINISYGIVIQSKPYICYLLIQILNRIVDLFSECYQLQQFLNHDTILYCSLLGQISKRQGQILHEIYFRYILNENFISIYQSPVNRFQYFFLRRKYITMLCNN
uniref:Transmembrane domain-containing protein n=1 Tax=Spironucleus salmonicida TaxID=348837 RepID=V6LU76_9EUKA|eukprot:EST47808.1 Transmembrane domain-containing protein [Spironucleus salmonicida]